MNKLHRIVAQSCAAALLATAAAGVASAPTASAATAGGTSITVYLTPPDPAGLSALAQAQGLSHDERIARLDQLLPDPAPVAARLASLGLTVTGEDPWSVTAQAPDSTIAGLFGTRPTLTSLVGATVDQVRAATSSLPLLPAVLQGLVSAVVPAAGPAVQRAHSVSYTGSQIRSAYNLPYDGSASQTPYSSGVVPTVASIQFSTDPTLMTDLGRVGSVRPGQVQEVTVTPPNDTSGADEVALDQEALLSVAPGVNQRIYYAANTPDMGPAFQAVLNDVRAGRSDIVALTTSWGRCESSIDSGTLHATDTILQSLVAAGVTVFAASGDSGIYDCDTPPNATLCPLVCPGPTVDVDFPASSPSVVGVGGTNLAGVGGPQTAWSCNSGAGQSLVSTLGNCYSPPAGNGGGSGGGASTAFPMPQYQRANLTPTYTASTQRLVPDIAALGDPATGFATYLNGSSTPVTVGGTSLSTPVSAGLFAATLGHYNVPSGIGDVHPWLYRILAKGNQPIYGYDVTSDISPGTNGANADKSPNDPSVAATLGYDTVTGLGSVNWDAFKFNLLAGAPSVQAGLRASGGNVVASWNVTTARTGSGLAGISVTVTSNGVTVFSESNPVAQASGVFPGTPGANYTMIVTATDLVGHTSVSPTTRMSMPITAPTGAGTVSGSGTTTIDDVLLKGSGWQHVRMRGALGGKVLATSARGRRLSISITGQTITLSFFAGPANGRLAVIVDGKRQIVDEYSPRTVRKSVTVLVSSSPGPHSVQLVSTGSRNRHSHGRTVDVDFLTAYLP